MTLESLAVAARLSYLAGGARIVPRLQDRNDKNVVFGKNDHTKAPRHKDIKQRKKEVAKK